MWQRLEESEETWIGWWMMTRQIIFNFWVLWVVLYITRVEPVHRFAVKYSRWKLLLWRFPATIVNIHNLMICFYSYFLTVLLFGHPGVRVTSIYNMFLCTVPIYCSTSELHHQLKLPPILGHHQPQQQHSPIPYNRSTIETSRVCFTPPLEVILG